MLNILAKFFANKVRSDYDAIAESFSETREQPWEGFHLIKKHFNKEKTVLDIGCGNGRTADFFEYKSYTGIDISEKLIQIAKRRTKPTANNNINFEVGDFTNLPYSKKFDLVLSIAVFHHLPSPKLRKKALEEVQKVITKNGLFVFSVWNLNTEKYKKQRRAALLRSIFTFGVFHPRDLFIQWKKGLHKRRRYYYAFKEKEITTLLHKFGFETIDIIPESNGKRVETSKSHNMYFIVKKTEE